MPDGAKLTEAEARRLFQQVRQPNHATIGSLTLLVYRECPCGKWCATGEAAPAPMCEECGGYFVPGGGPHNEAMFGKIEATGGSYAESRQIRGLAFIAFLTSESGAVTAIAKVKRMLGLYSPVGELVEKRLPDEDGCYYLPDERSRASDEIKDAKKGRS